LGPAASSHTINGVAAGPHCYRVIAIGDKASGVDDSDPSNVSCKTNVAPLPSTPNPPVLQVVDNRAYKLDIGYQDQIKIVQVGFVPVGTRCIDQAVMGLNVVAIGKRTTSWGKSTSPLLKDASGGLVGVPKQVFARCTRNG
jgi:hypothetical protein